MASINGKRGDLLTPPPVMAPAKDVARKLVHKEVVVEAPCDGCGAMLSGKEFRSANDHYDMVCGEQDPDEYLCTHCFRMLTAASGRLGLSAKSVLAHLEKIRETGFVVVMDSGSFGADGITLQVEFGDVFKVRRVGAEQTDRPSYERSKARFSVDISVGPVVLTLWAREVAAMPFVTIMRLQQGGDYQMAFVSQDDQEGYWTLTPKSKKLVRNTFGNR